MHILFAITDVPYVLQVFGQRQEALDQLKSTLRGWARQQGLLGVDEQVRRLKADQPSDQELVGVWLEETSFGWVLKRAQQTQSGWLFDATSLTWTRLAEIRLVCAEQTLCGAELKALHQAALEAKDELDRLHQIANELEVNKELQQLCTSSRNRQISQLEAELGRSQREQQEQALGWMLERSLLEQKLEQAGLEQGRLQEKLAESEGRAEHLEDALAREGSANHQRSQERALLDKQSAEEISALKDRLSKLETALQMQEAASALELAALQLKLDEVENNRNELCQQIGEHEGALHLAQQRYEQAIASARFLEAELKNCEETARTQAEELQTCQQQRKLEEQVATFEALMTQDQLHGLDKRLKATLQELSAKQSDLNTANEINLELIFDLERKNSECVKLNLDKQNAEQRAITLKEQLERASQRLEASESNLGSQQRQLERLSQNLNKTADQLQVQERLLELSQQTLEKTTTEYGYCRAQLAECQEQLACSTDWIETLESINAQRSEALGERSELQDRVLELHTALEQSRDLTAISNSENSVLRSALEKTTADLQSLRRQTDKSFDRYENEVKLLKQEIALRESWADALAADQTNSLKEEIGDLEKENAQLRKRLEFEELWNSELTRSLDAQENDCSFYRNELERAVEECQHFKDLAEERQQELSANMIDMDQLATAQQESASALEQKQSRVRELESMVRRLEKELASIAEMEKDLLQQNLRKDWEISDLRNAFTRDFFP